jgi:hypothetical protein
VHIVPYLPPQSSGVGDYATLVGRRMEEIGGVTCGYVAAGVNAVDLPNDGEHVRNVTGRCEPKALWQAVEELADENEPSPGPTRPSSPQASLRRKGNLTVVLHYSGYGYDRNGAPAWLADALGQRSSGRAAHVVSYFHELYATGRPWQRAFWYSARQRRVAIEIAELSDFVLTNREQSARWLEEQTSRPVGSVASLPVPSNVGEPNFVPDYDSRPRRAVVFGDVPLRAKLLNYDARAVVHVLCTLGIKDLVDIGRHFTFDEGSFARAGIAVKRLGYLDAAEIGRELLQCRVGLIHYPLSFVAKSSTFAAYAAHGVVPVVRADDFQSADGVEIGRNTIAFPIRGHSAQVDVPLSLMSTDIHRWYQRGRSTNHAYAVQQTTNGAINIEAATFLDSSSSASTS